jgi:serine/threonine-protein kinase
MPGRRLARVLSEDAPPVATLRPDLPPALAACVDRALARDRTKRYASARAFADALLQAADTPSLAVCAASPRSSPDASWMRGASLLAVIAVIAVTWAIVARRVRRAEAPRASLAASSMPRPTTPPQAPIPEDAALAPTVDAAVTVRTTPPIAHDRPTMRPRRPAPPAPLLSPYEIE